MQKKKEEVFFDSKRGCENVVPDLFPHLYGEASGEKYFSGWDI
jgi:hypothetical protein